MLIDCLGTTSEIEELFGDKAVLAAMLQYEFALAKSQARMGIIPEEAAQAILRVTVGKFDAGALAREARDAATVVVPFVRELRKQSVEAHEYAHWGATSQDVIDTSLVLLLRRVRELFEWDHKLLSSALRALSQEHRNTLMLGRTLMQPAAPITFGYKVAGWYGGVTRSWRRVQAAFDEALVLQFGGATGTLAVYDELGPALRTELAKELALQCPPPWHAHRDRLAALMAQLGIYVGSLGKIARDVVLLMQFEVGEVSEEGGASSAMPHKRNPAGCALTIAAASRAPSLVGAYLSAADQEHERAAGAWQSEWQTVADIVAAAGSALSAIRKVIENLKVDPQRMQANLRAAGGRVLSEKALAMLAPRLGRDEASRVVEERLDKLTGLAESEFGRVDDYLGASELFRRQLLEDPE